MTFEAPPPKKKTCPQILWHPYEWGGGGGNESYDESTGLRQEHFLLHTRNVNSALTVPDALLCRENAEASMALLQASQILQIFIQNLGGLGP